eukprot:Phypoly_transcript_25444.p1 GENE.Phypoly_transcript_25444~~Phypoly_transcript_25444.p1  ORF type:complete len:169 (+),score=15.73 Phypoly_transcript_25444:76-507(+)
MKLAGDIFIDFKEGNKATGISVQEAMRKCESVLNSSGTVLFFPEGLLGNPGTRKLLPFKNGAFRLSYENKSNIAPFTILHSDKALPPVLNDNELREENWKKYLIRPASISLACGKLINVTNFLNPQEIQQHVYGVMEQMLKNS